MIPRIFPSETGGVHPSVSDVDSAPLADTGHAPARDAELPKRYEMIALGNADMTRLVDVWLPPMVHPARVDDDAFMEPLRDMVLQVGAEVHERQIRALIDRPDATSILHTLLCPILLLTGRQDDWSPVAQHQEIADLAPDAELVVIEDAGHFAPIEQPAAVIEAVNEWLARRFGATLPC